MSTEPPRSARSSATATPLGVAAGRRIAAVYRAVAGPSGPLDLRILGRVLLHAALVGAFAGLVGALLVVVLDRAEHLLVHASGLVPLVAAGEPPVTLPEGTPARPWLFLGLPALGGLLTGLLAHRFAPEILGGGADAAIDAFHRRSGEIRRRVLPLKFLASVLTLGTGGSGGREGPTMHVGAAVGALVGKALRVGPRERRVLLVSGMAAGLSAVFRTPLGAALLAVEVLHRDDFESEAIVPAVLASVVAYSVFTSFFGEGFLFAHAPRYPFLPAHLPWYVLLAIVVAACARLFSEALRRARHAFERAPGPAWLRPALGGLALGALAVPSILLLGSWTGAADQRFGLLGGGYGAAQVAIVGAPWIPAGLDGASLLLVLAGLKIVATALTVGSGGSAGDFGPSLTMGALVGGAFGHAARLLDPSLDPGACALVGMSTFYGGIAHVPLAAVVLVCELAGSYDLLLPLMLSAGIAFVLNRRASLYHAQPASRRESPAHRGDLVVDVLRTIPLAQVLRPAPVAQLSPRASAVQIERTMATHEEQDVFPVTDDGGRVIGMVTSDVLRSLATSPDLEGLVIAEDLMRKPVTLRPTADLHQALSTMLEHGLREVIVVDERGLVIGLLDEAEVGAAYHAATLEAEPRSESISRPPPTVL